VTRWFEDPRGEEGDLLCPSTHPRSVIDAVKTESGSHTWATQYQQQPSFRAGGMFKRQWFKIVEAIPAECNQRVRAWDLAASEEKGSSWTVGVKMATDKKRWYIEDVVRMRATPTVVRQSIRNMASSDKQGCKIRIPQDPGQAGKDQAASIIAELAGFPITSIRQTGDKGTRAEPLANQFEAGNVYLLRGDWNDNFIEELCAFPQGHDDQVDSAAEAFNALAEDAAPTVRISSEFLASTRKRTNGFNGHGARTWR
jgi:predicted phage terminase large subunit-like protein